MIGHLRGNGLMETDHSPPKLSECAAAVVSKLLLNGNTTHEKTTELPTNSPCNQLIADYVFRDMSRGLPLDQQCRILKSFDQAPLQKLDARRSNVSLEALLHYLSDRSCATSMICLSLPPVFHAVQTQPPIASKTSNVEFTNLEHLELGTRVYTSAIFYTLRAIVKRSPNLTALTLHGPFCRPQSLHTCAPLPSWLIRHVFLAIPKVTYLDLSFQYPDSFGFLAQLRCLTSLILHDVENISEIIESIIAITHLQQLDVSQSDHGQHGPGDYVNPTITLDKIVRSLRSLQYLDISGTNLAFETVAVEHVGDENVTTDIVGLRKLQSRLKFLGIAFSTACRANHIPAESVGGTASEEQILNSLAAHARRPYMHVALLDEARHLINSEHTSNEFIVSCIGHVATFAAEFASDHTLAAKIAGAFRFLLCGAVRLPALKLPPGLVLRLLHRLTEYLERSLGTSRTSRPICESIASLLVEGSIPPALNARLAIAAAKLIEKKHHEEICIYILGAAVDDASDEAKIQIATFGAVTIIVRSALYSDGDRPGTITEAYLSILLNLTDNCPGNAQKALNEIDKLFYWVIDYGQTYPAVTLMTGIFHNISDVPHLRCFLISDKYVRRFLVLLDEFTVDFEASFHSAGILVNLLADTDTPVGDKYWNEKVRLTPAKVCDRVSSAINAWDIDVPVPIDCSTFVPLLRLLQSDGHVVGDYYAIWTMVNYTTRRNDNRHVVYRSLAIREGILDFLQPSNFAEGCAKWSDDPYISSLALVLLNNLTL